MPIYGLADDCKLGVLGKLECVTLNMLGCSWLSFAFRSYCWELQIGPSREPVNRAGRVYAGMTVVWVRGSPGEFGAMVSCHL